MNNDYGDQVLLESETMQPGPQIPPTLPVCVTEKVITEEVTSQELICDTKAIQPNGVEELCGTDQYRTRLQITATTGKVAIAHSKARAERIAAGGTLAAPPTGLSDGASFGSLTLLTTARIWVVDLSGAANNVSYVIERRNP